MTGERTLSRRVLWSRSGLWDGFEKKIDDGRQARLGHTIPAKQGRPVMESRTPRDISSPGATGKRAVTAYDQAGGGRSISFHGDFRSGFVRMRRARWRPGFRGWRHLGESLGVWPWANDPGLIDQGRGAGPRTARGFTLKSAGRSPSPSALSHSGARRGRARRRGGAWTGNLMRLSLRPRRRHQGAALTERDFLGRFPTGSRDRSARSPALCGPRDQPGYGSLLALPRLRAGGSRRLRPRARG